MGRDNYEKMHAILDELGKLEREGSAFFKLSSDLLGVFDLKTNRWTSVSDSWKDVLGWDPLEVVELDMEELVHPEDLERDKQEASKGLLDFYNGLSSRTNEHITRNIHKNGSYIAISWNAVLDVESGKAYCVGRPVVH